MKLTADDRELARAIVAALKPHLISRNDTKEAEEKIAKVLSALHDRAVSCAVVRAERERETPKTKRTKGANS